MDKKNAFESLAEALARLNPIKKDKGSKRKRKSKVVLAKEAKEKKRIKMAKASRKKNRVKQW